MEHSKQIISSSLMLLVANLIGSVLGYVFHLAVARLGGPVVYADLGVLISLLMIFSVLSLTIQMHTADRTARSLARGEDVSVEWGLFLRFTLFFSVPLMLLLLVFGAPLTKFLQLQQEFCLFVLALGLIPLYFTAVIRGGLQGKQRFWAFSILRVIEPTLQLGLGVGLVLAGFGAVGAFSGTVVGICLVLVVGFIILKPRLTGTIRDSIIAWKRDGHFVGFFVFLLVVNLFVNLDILFVKHHFVPEVAAQYIAAAFMGRLLILSAMAIGVVLLPKVAAVHDQNQSNPVQSQVILKSLVTYALFAIPFVVILVTLNHEIVSVFYGLQYPHTAELLKWILGTNAFAGAAYLLGMYGLAQRMRLTWVSFLGGCVLQVSFFYYPPESIDWMARYMFYFGCMIIVVMLGFVCIEKYLRQREVCT